MNIRSLAVTDKGTEVFLLSNDSGFSVQALTYGARLHRICLADRAGKPIDVLAGFDDPDGYRGDNPYFNAVIGRVANRIGEARFELNQTQYTLFPNDGNHSLHGGKSGFDRKEWAPAITEDGLELRYVSPDGEEGYPGSLDVRVIYSVGDDDSLTITYRAVSDADTVCNLTNHAYFNLGGFESDALEHEVRISSRKMTAIDAELIPRGAIEDISGTVYDFRSPKTIGADIRADDFYLNVAGGYDFNYILEKDEDSPAATAHCPASGVFMEVFTDRPCMQFYTGNFLDGLRGKTVYGRNSAFCMETQLYPNAVNVPSFPPVTLAKGETFRSVTTYRFSLRDR